MVLEKNVVNNIQGSFPDLSSVVNDIEDGLYQKTFGIAYLKNVVNNLNIIDLQQKTTKVEATLKVSNK